MKTKNRVILMIVVFAASLLLTGCKNSHASCDAYSLQKVESDSTHS